MTLNPAYDVYDAFALQGAAADSEAERVGTFEYSVRGGRFSWSPAAAAMHGHSPAAAQPSIGVLVQHAHLEDRVRVADFVRRVVEGQSVSSRHRIINGAGQQLWVVAIGNSTPDATRGTAQVRGLIIDVTDLVQSGISDAVAEMVTARAGIEQAKGVLRAAYGVSADEAFGMLVRRSQATNTKVKDLASLLIDAVSSGVTRGMRLQVDSVLKSVRAAS